MKLLTGLLLMLQVISSMSADREYNGTGIPMHVGSITDLERFCLQRQLTALLKYSVSNGTQPTVGK